jgi:hypothetical protein
MATTVIGAFSDFKANTNITDRQEKIVSTCRENVVRVLGEKLTLHSEQPSLLIGSYDRDTMPRYLKDGDVDVMVVLHYGQHSDWDDAEGTSKALQRFKSILQAEYTDTPCGVDRNCVTMQLSEFRLDVVPAFRFKDGTHKIPDTYRKKWLPTQPQSFADEVTRINKNIDGKFVPFVKMVKSWNRQYKTRLRSFHLECVLLKHYAGYTEGYTYHSTASVFFGALPGYLNGEVTDPISGDRVDLYMGNSSLGYDRDVFVKRAEKAATLAKSAYDHSEQYPVTAIAKWKELFGELFPAYG